MNESEGGVGFATGVALVSVMTRGVMIDKYSIRC